MNKMVINHLEKLFVTNDAATILNELQVFVATCYDYWNFIDDAQSKLGILTLPISLISISMVVFSVPHLCIIANFQKNKFNS